MSTLQFEISRHPKTGKRSIEMSEITLKIKGRKVQIYMAQFVQVDIDDIKCSRTFERSVPLLQLLYYIIEEVEKR